MSKERLFCVTFFWIIMTITFIKMTKLVKRVLLNKTNRTLQSSYEQDFKMTSHVFSAVRTFFPVDF